MLFRGTEAGRPSKASLILITAGFFSTGLAFYVFLSLAGKISAEENIALDSAFSNIIAPFSSPELLLTMGYLTEAGSIWWLGTASILVVIYIFFFSKLSRWTVFYFIIAMIGVSVLTTGAKLFFARERPEVIASFDGTGYSFPSGHASGAITFYGFLIYLVSVSEIDRKMKWFINIFLSLLISLIALSRLFVNVHYFSDILAGLALGFVWLMVCVTALEMTLRQKRRRQSACKSLNC
ncbi:phosphatase PAP2 family protein [Salipaludibacillus aurantiacus]|uniref:Undecaprenyl-diphosphatase n=1 Tax=Salipaludibacillus aurantiacus TaxID=1601833 RepID=A0A1H9VXL4_9BACI|nr:phosphatase PAP2 family protein [Salipaludibacillus aurantiacus]SES26269.1 undecaprenyl-diphosphatase [Salipaludibacillus aurantiacus]